MYLCIQLGQSPLISASYYGHQKCAGLLIDAGANVDMQKEVSSCMVSIRCSVHISGIGQYCACMHAC